MPVRKKFCEAEARNLLRGARISAPPVDVEGLAEALLLKVNRVAGWKHHARALLAYGEIRVNADQSPAGQRFSIAHEIGHHLLHPDGFVFSDHEDPESDRYAADPDRALEREAEYFADMLLMPSRWLRKDIVQGRLKAPDLALRYEVSADALFIAIMQRGLLNQLSE